MRDFDLSVAEARLGLAGGIDIPSASFFAEGDGFVKAFGYKLAGAHVIGSTVGIATCGSVLPLVDMGFEYEWDESFGFDNFDAPPDCDIDMAKYKPAAFQKAKAGGGFAGGFTLPEGLRTATARLDGAGGAPGFTLTGPNGLRISYPGPAAGTVTGKGFAVVTVRGQTFVRLAHPSGGPYRVVGAGGTSITELAVAHGLPDPKVHGKVIRLHGRKRLLRYRGSGLSGQKVMFVEQGKGVRDVIATTRKHRGKIRFQPASGPRGRAAIVAIVTRHGIPRVQMTVAHFKAPGPLLPGRPRHVRLRRRGTKLVVRWKAAPRARRYAVAWALRDGRRQAKIVRGHRLRIRGVPGIDAGRIKVAGLRRDNVAGPAARAKLKRHPKHRHHHRHHHHRRSRA